MSLISLCSLTLIAERASAVDLVRANQLQLPALESPYIGIPLLCPENGVPRGIHCDNHDSKKFYLSCLKTDILGVPVNYRPYRAVDGHCPTGYVCYTHGTTEEINRGIWKEGSGKPLSQIDCLTPTERLRRMRARARDNRRRRDDDGPDDESDHKRKKRRRTSKHAPDSSRPQRTIARQPVFHNFMGCDGDVGSCSKQTHSH